MKNILKQIILYLFTIILSTPVFSQIQEVEIFNEWFIEDCSCSFQRQFFFIRDYESFNNFWKKLKLGNIAPYFDFDKYMVFVWAPGLTRKECSKVSFERLLYKEGNLLLLMDFADSDKFYGRLRRPVKFSIFQSVKNSDLFVFKKIKTGWQQYDYKPIYSVWNMDTERKRSLIYTMMDKTEAPKITLATYSAFVTPPEKKQAKNETSTESVQTVQPVRQNPSNIGNKSKVEPIRVVAAPRQPSTPKQTASIQTPRALPEPISPKMQTATQPQQPRADTPAKPTSQPSKPTGVVSNSPIVIGGTPAPTTKTDSKPDAAPGMGEDPLFGSEFDITF